jgi:hypothetical protein
VDQLLRLGQDQWRRRDPRNRHHRHDRGQAEEADAQHRPMPEDVERIAALGREDRHQAGDTEHGTELASHVEQAASGTEPRGRQRHRARAQQRGDRQPDAHPADQLYRQ